MTDSLIQTEAPLKPSYLPTSFVNRNQERSDLELALSEKESGPRNCYVYGRKGSGKTHLVRRVLVDLPDSVTISYVPCKRCDTQYKALQRICGAVTGESIPDGFHTSELQNQIEDRTSIGSTVIVLDDIEFLLQNDGDDLLYFLSRLDHGGNVGIVAVSSRFSSISEPLEERTYSSFHPERINLEAYSPEHLFQILKQRAEQALQPHSVHRKALQAISSKTQNASLGICWLRTAAIKAEGPITESMISKTYRSGLDSYVQDMLLPFSDHHVLLYEVIRDLTADGDFVRSGSIYDVYRRYCDSLDPLSDRRVSELLKHLELLGLIAVDYKYGGIHGKTRFVRVQHSHYTKL